MSTRDDGAPRADRGLGGLRFSRARLDTPTRGRSTTSVSKSSASSRDLEHLSTRGLLAGRRYGGADGQPRCGRRVRQLRLFRAGRVSCFEHGGVVRHDAAGEDTRGHDTADDWARGRRLHRDAVDRRQRGPQLSLRRRTAGTRERPACGGPARVAGRDGAGILRQRRRGLWRQSARPHLPWGRIAGIEAGRASTRSPFSTCSPNATRGQPTLPSSSKRERPSASSIPFSAQADSEPFDSLP